MGSGKLEALHAGGPQGGPQTGAGLVIGAGRASLRAQLALVTTDGNLPGCRGAEH